jgi:hypothetical protein
MMLMSTKIVRPPIGTFEDDVDPVGFARKVAAEYATMENGYHAQLRSFLQKAYHSYQLFLEFPDAFEKLKQDPFWENSRQKPSKDLTTSRWILYFIMRAAASNDRARSTKYATVLDKFARAGIKVAQVADRIKKLGGVEAAYKRIVAAEQRRSKASADGGMEDEERPIHQQQKLHASRKDDAKVHGEQMEVETGSSFDAIRTTTGDRSPMRYFDPKRVLFVELQADELARIVDAGSTADGPVLFRLDITVHPRNASGFAHVDCDRVLRDAEVAEEIQFDPELDLLSIDRPKDPLWSSVTGGRRERAPGVPKPTRNPWAGRKGSPHLKLKLRPKLSRAERDERPLGRKDRLTRGEVEAG